MSERGRRPEDSETSPSAPIAGRNHALPADQRPRSARWDTRDRYPHEWYSGELDIGLQANLHALRAHLVDDPDFGRGGYGAEFTETDEARTLKPWKGLRVRLILRPLGMSIQTVNAGMGTVTVRKDRTGVALKLTKPHEKVTRGQLTIRGMPSGTYRMSMAAISVTIPRDGTVTCDVSVPAEATITLVES